MITKKNEFEMSFENQNVLVLNKVFKFGFKLIKKVMSNFLIL